MTKSYGSTKGNLRLSARYLGTKQYEEKYGSLADEVDELSDDTNISDGTDISEVMEDKNPEYKEYMKLWYKKADTMIKKIDEMMQSSKSKFANVDESDLTDEELEEMNKQLNDFLNDIIHDEKTPADNVEIGDIAIKLDGVYTSNGQHAAGTIFSKDTLSDIIPLMYNTKKKNFSTQCTMAQAEAKGLLKMDLLNLNNLNIITKIIKTVGDETLQDYEKRDAMLKDPNIYKDIFWTGLTQGVFQFESAGMKKMLMEFRPESFEDIILLVAAYRPGPMQYLSEIIAQKKYDDWKSGKLDISAFSQDELLPDGTVREPIHSIDIENEALQKIIGPTYGCIIYQEQVMQIFQDLAGYSLGGADLVRRAMSKKHLEELVPERQAFLYGDKERNIQGCIEKQGISAEEGNKLFDQIMDFAAYAFNKSHATAYAMVAMFTAYLKEYHTPEFFKESLNAVGALKEIPPFIYELPSFGIKLEPPSVKSQNEFSIDMENRNIIHFGLSNIKGCPSENNIVLDENLELFIRKNPNISLKLVEKYIQLGMFKECWKEDARKGRVHGNRHECLRWLNGKRPLTEKEIELINNGDSKDTRKPNAENLQNYLECENMLIDINEQIDIVKLQIAAYPEDKELQNELTQTLTNLKKDLLKITDKKASYALELNRFLLNDRAKGIVPNETDKEILENRKWEIEMLSFPFDIEKSLKKISEIKNSKNFDNLATSKEQNNNYNTILIPAIVLSISDAKKNKSGTSIYYDVQLMDKNRKIINRRFDNPPDILEGEFSLTIDTCKYFNCKTKDIKGLKDESTKSKLPKTKGENFYSRMNGDKRSMIVNGKVINYHTMKMVDEKKAKTIDESMNADNLSLEEEDMER